MKVIIPLIAVITFTCAGCTREENRYEIVRAENGVIRIDKKTGEMVAVSDFNVPALIDTKSLGEKSEIDPLLAKVKTFPPFHLPSAKKTVIAIIEYRWIQGRFDYRMRLAPYIEELNSPLRGQGTSFEILLNDSDGFVVQRFDAPFSSLIRSVGADDTPAAWQAEGSIPMSKADYGRVVDMTYSWRYSAELDKALNEDGG